MAEFDPLEYYSLSEKQAPDTLKTDENFDSINISLERANNSLNASDFTSDEDDIPYTDILDFPSVSDRPPYEVFAVIFKLLALDEQTNFGPGKLVSKKLPVQDILEKKNVPKDQFLSAFSWLHKHHIGVGKTPESFAGLYYCSGSISKNQMIGYLTGIVSSALSYFDNETQRNKLMEQAARLIGENSGRTARAGFVRTIVVPGFKNETIKIREPAMTEDNIGMKTWGSSLIIAQKIVSKTNELLREPILELGSGTGLTGIVCRKLGFRNIISTDLPSIVQNLKANFVLNDLKSDLSSCKVLDWSNFSDFRSQNPECMFSTIILSDPIYSDEHPAWICNVLKEFLAPNDPEARVIIEIPLRNLFEKTRENFWNLLDGLGLVVTTFEKNEGYDDFGEYNFLFKIYKWRKYCRT